MAGTIEGGVRASVEEVFGVSEKQRFEAELEFVQGLASPQYLNWLGQNRFFEDPTFVEYLAYLQYWREPRYAAFLQFPHCLHFLDLLQAKPFRDSMSSNHAKEMLHAQQLYFYQHYRNNRIQQSNQKQQNDGKTS